MGDSMIYKNLNVLDVINEKWLEHTDIEIKDGSILNMGKLSGVYEDFSYENCYMIPGLIDCHTHIFMAGDADTIGSVQSMNTTDYVLLAIKNLERHIKSGVTTIRDVGGINHHDIELKKHIKNGELLSPDLYAAGKIVTMTGGHGYFIGREADGETEVRKAVREQLKAGADLIKVISSGGVLTPGVDVNAYQFNIDELKAATEETHKAGRKICTHCHSTQGIKNSVLAGIDSIEHATLLDREGAQMMSEAQTYMVPTLSAVDNIVKKGKDGGIPEFALKKGFDVYQKHLNSFRLALEYNIPIAMGTDAGTPLNYHGESPREILLMIENGMRVLEAIKTSTINGAKLVGIGDKAGSISIGKNADLVIFKTNPEQQPETLLTPLQVIKSGRHIL